MRGEETLVLGTGIENGLICSAGTHPKWIEMKDGRIERFATYMTGEMYALLREHSMIGRPATEPEDPKGFDLGLDAAERNAGEATASACCTSCSAPARPSSPAAWTAACSRPTCRAFSRATRSTARCPSSAAPPPSPSSPSRSRAELYVHALKRHGIEAEIKVPQQALIAGLARIVRQHALG